MLVWIDLHDVCVVLKIWDLAVAETQFREFWIVSASVTQVVNVNPKIE